MPAYIVKFIAKVNIVKAVYGRNVGISFTRKLLKIAPIYRKLYYKVVLASKFLHTFISFEAFNLWNFSGVLLYLQPREWYISAERERDIVLSGCVAPSSIFILIDRSMSINIQNLSSEEILDAYPVNRC